MLIKITAEVPYQQLENEVVLLNLAGEHDGGLIDSSSVVTRIDSRWQRSGA